MGALPEYKTRLLLQREEVPVVDGLFIAAGERIPEELPRPPLFLKAQIPGATSRAAHGLVRRVATTDEVTKGLQELLAPGPWGQAEGVLVAREAAIVKEYYAACMLSLGSADQLPGGILVFSTEGGSGVEERAESLDKIFFSLLELPTAEILAGQLGEMSDKMAVAAFLERFIATFSKNKLTVLETNPLCVLDDGSLAVVDCRAEYESHAIAKSDKDLFAPAVAASQELTSLEAIVAQINDQDPAGTGFVRETRGPIPRDAWRVATNLCGGGGKMLWEMTTGARKDIFTMNESDTSGGLSAFKSYRIFRSILENMKESQVVILTGSGMGFQNQRYLASAIWKGLRESPRPLPVMLRFGGTDEDKARELFERIGASLPVKVKVYLAHIFPNAMVDDVEEIATKERLTLTPEPQPVGEPTFSVETPLGDFFFFPDKWISREAPPCVAACPSGFLAWNQEKQSIEPVAGARCTGCLECETISLLESNGELRIRLNMPEVE